MSKTINGTLITSTLIMVGIAILPADDESIKARCGLHAAQCVIEPDNGRERPPTHTGRAASAYVSSSASVDYGLTLYDYYINDGIKG